ncbi:MAG: hypothetical protein JXA54_05005 [Candidatus Heimdallarchaeota archaeon]|nr:hypothetical protein [Candidatus Heimdallarchaeota archaeon]
MTFEHLCFVYGKDYVLKWVTKLKIFRLCGCYPYPADLTPERFLAKICYKSDSELSQIMKKLNLTNSSQKPRNIQFQKSTESHSYGWVLLNGNPCYLDINKVLKTIIFEISGTNDEPFKLSDETFKQAKRIEDYLQNLGLIFHDPPQDDNYCVAPKFYPEVWVKE